MVVAKDIAEGISRCGGDLKKYFMDELEGQYSPGVRPRQVLGKQVGVEEVRIIWKDGKSKITLDPSRVSTKKGLRAFFRGARKVDVFLV